MNAHTPGEVWEAVGMNVYRGKDCIGIFDTDNATIELMEERARIAAAAPEALEALIAIVEYEANPDFSLWAKRIDAARAAIAKATGTGIFPGSYAK